MRAGRFRALGTRVGPLAAHSLLHRGTAAVPCLPPRLPCELHECLVRGRSATPACLVTPRRARSLTCLPFPSLAVQDAPWSDQAPCVTAWRYQHQEQGHKVLLKGSGSGRSPSTPSWCGARDGPLRALARSLLLRLLFAGPVGGEPWAGGGSSEGQGAAA